ncbi:MAG: TraR/DksA C4-type zinc finger protein [Oscillospiraceae bacterium]
MSSPRPSRCRARRSSSTPTRCACCGETTGANWIRLVDGQTLCLDCAGSYDRFDV